MANRVDDWETISVQDDWETISGTVPVPKDEWETIERPPFGFAPGKELDPEGFGTRPKLTYGDPSLPKAGITDVPGIAGRSLVSAELGVAKSILGTLDAALNVPAKKARQIGTPWAPSLPTREEQIKATEGIKEARLKIISAQKKFGARYSGALAWTTRVISEAVPYMANAFTAGIMAGPAGAATVGFIVEGDNAYDDAKASGANEEQAQRERVVVGSINAIIEAVQIGRIMKFSKGGKHSLKNFVKLARTKGTQYAGAELKGWSGEVARVAIEEALEEFGQEGVSLGIPAVFRGEYPKKKDGSPDWLAMGERLGEAALGGLVAGPVLGGAGRIITGGPMLPISPETKTAIQQLEDDINETMQVTPAINVYKTVSGSRTGITEAEVKRVGERYVDTVTGEDIVLDPEASGSGRLDTPTSKQTEFQKTTVDRIDESEPTAFFSTEAHKEREVQKLINEGMDRKDAESITLTPDEYKAEKKRVKEEEELAKATKKVAIKNAGPKGQINARLDTIKRKNPTPTARLQAGKILTFGMKIKDTLSSYVLRQDRVSNLARNLDGYDDNGPLTTYLIRPMRAAIVRGRDATMKAMVDIRTKLDENGTSFKKLLKKKKTNIAGGLRLRQTQIGGVYLLSQNENGRRRLDATLGKETVDEIVKLAESSPDLLVLTKAIQDYVAKRSEMFFAAAEAMEIEVTPEEAYITLLSLNPADIDKLPIMDRYKKVFKKGVEAKGEEKTIARTKTDAAVEFDLIRILPNMIQGMENFIEAGPAAQVVDDILHDPGVKERLNRVTRGHGSEIFDTWLQQSAAGSPDSPYSRTSAILQHLRGNSMHFVLGGKILTVCPQQSVSLWNAVAIRPAIMPGMFARLASYGDMGILGRLEGDFTLASSKSVMLKNRDWERDVRRTFSEKGMRRFFAHKPLSPLSMRVISTIDRATVTAVWLSTYDRAIADGMDEKIAVQHADDMITQTQSMGNVEDLPELFRGGHIEQLITVFLNEPNQAMQNLRHNIVGEMRAGKISKLKAFERFLIGQVVPSQVMGLISRGRLPDDFWEMTEDLAFYLTTPWFFFGRWGYNAVTGFWDAEDSAVSTLPLTGFEEASQGIRAAKKGDIRGVIEHGVGSVGAFTGKIPKQAITTTSGTLDLLLGETDNWRRLYYSKYMVEKIIDKNVVKPKPGGL